MVTPRLATALIVFEFDLAINAVIAVGVAAIDLPGFGGDGEGVADQNQFAALVITTTWHNLAFDLHLPRLLLHGGRIELLLHHIAQDDCLAAIGAEDFVLATGQRLVNLGLIGEGLIVRIVLPVATAVMPQPHDILRVFGQMVVNVAQKDQPRVLIHIGIEIDLQPRRALCFAYELQPQALAGLGFEIGGVFPQRVGLEGFGVMQPHDQRGVKVFDVAAETIGHQHVWITGLRPAFANASRSLAVADMRERESPILIR